MPEQRLSTLGLQTHLEVTAYHEAGHAFVALLLGIRMVEVCIDRQRPGTGHTAYRASHMILGRSREPYTVVQSRWARSLTREQRRAVFSLAGPLAEAKFLGNPIRTLGSISDLEMVHQLVCCPDTQGNYPPHGAVRPDANLFFKAELRRTRRILSQPSVWIAVSLIAADLLNWGKLKTDDVAETLQWAMGGCRQMGLFTGIGNKTETAAACPKPVTSTVVGVHAAQSAQKEKQCRYLPPTSIARNATSYRGMPAVFTPQPGEAVGGLAARLVRGLCGTGRSGIAENR